MKWTRCRNNEPITIAHGDPWWICCLHGGPADGREEPMSYPTPSCKVPLLLDTGNYGAAEYRLALDRLDTDRWRAHYYLARVDYDTRRGLRG